MTKQVLVCGAGGFIGSHLVKRLKAEGCWVRGVDLKFPEFSETAADGSARHYGGNDEAIHRTLSAHGFSPFRYDPFRRSLEARSEQAECGNTLYVRDPGLVRARLSSSHRYRLNTGHEI